MCLDRVNIVSEYDQVVRSPSFEMRLPSVISLKEFIAAARRPAFTRFNVFLRDRFVCQYCGDCVPVARPDLRPCGAALARRPHHVGERRHRLLELQPAQGQPAPGRERHVSAPRAAPADDARSCARTAAPSRPTSCTRAGATSSTGTPCSSRAEALSRAAADLPRKGADRLLRSDHSRPSRRRPVIERCVDVGADAALLRVGVAQRARRCSRGARARQASPRTSFHRSSCWAPSRQAGRLTLPRAAATNRGMSLLRHVRQCNVFSAERFLPLLHDGVRSGPSAARQRGDLAALSGRLRRRRPFA